MSEAVRRAIDDAELHHTICELTRNRSPMRALCFCLHRIGQRLGELTSAIEESTKGGP